MVAGGRFREPYYWDSFWIIEGLLRTKGSFTQIAENIIENFLDLVETIGFVPNGARRYYLNRSQPPLLTQMVRIYVEYTQNYTLLERALPLLEKEYEFWTNNRTVTLERAGMNYSLVSWSCTLKTFLMNIEPLRCIQHPAATRVISVSYTHLTLPTKRIV